MWVVCFNLDVYVFLPGDSMVWVMCYVSFYYQISGALFILVSSGNSCRWLNERDVVYVVLLFRLSGVAVRLASSVDGGVIVGRVRAFGGIDWPIGGGIGFPIGGALVAACAFGVFSGDFFFYCFFGWRKFPPRCCLVRGSQRVLRAILAQH